MNSKEGKQEGEVPQGKDSIKNLIIWFEKKIGRMRWVKEKYYVGKRANWGKHHNKYVDLEKYMALIEYYKVAALPAESGKDKQGEVVERFKRPTDKQIIGIAILFNDGKVDHKKLSDMVAMCDYVIDRLYENGDILIPSSKEKS